MSLSSCSPHGLGSSSCRLTKRLQSQSLFSLSDRVAHPSLLWIVMVTRERLTPHTEDSFSGALLPPASILSRSVPPILGVECSSPEFERLSDRHYQNDRLSDESAAIPAIRSKGPSSGRFKFAPSHSNAGDIDNSAKCPIFILYGWASVARCLTDPVGFSTGTCLITRDLIY